ncbi:hypothetical protein LAZ67_16002087 [Cordylochernes scorpioides]|uniref:Gag-Pol-p199 n=1 Tax=Cordylochernes scorpioides TaxID=51811 RepID=A0ABY6LC26_9ARAC|nr:hypothetical protein LAZ67_16002087 [Cordylochernes scorpioides]
MELDTHDKPQNSTNSKYMLRNRENINRPERLKDYEVLNSVSEEIGLLTYNEAVTGVEKENWVKAIQEEKDSLKKNETWDFVNAEEVKGKKILSSRWIFKIKDGGHYKARLVARGNEQKGLDFDETFSPVDMKITKLKALYGLRQAPSKWNKRFEAFLKTKGLVKSKLENCIFKTQNGSLILALYVDDGMLIGSDEEEMDNLLEELAQEFEIRISNNPEMFVGMNIMNKDEGLILSQHDYIECVLKKYNMLDAKPVTTPIVEGAVKIDPILENKSEDVLLPTLRVTLKGNRTEKTARAIIDTGSQRSYILHSTAMEMEYEQSRREFFRHSLFGGSSTDVVEHEVYTIHLSDINNSYRCEFEALGQPLICGSIPPVCPRSLLEGSEELDVSDLMRDRIEVLIGADIAGRLLTDDQRRISSGLVAIRTKLGWTVMGKIPPTEVRDDISSLCVTTLLSLDLENLWKLDAIGVSDAEVEKKTQSLQAEMEEHFAHTTTRDIEGRYEVALPWVQDKERIPSNKDLAENQLRSVRRKLEEVGDMKEYGQIFEEWMKQGIIEYAREDKLDGVHYLPHRPVYKRNSQTSRIRPVFNASARKRDKAPEHLKITAEQLKSSFYVDNCLSSFQNVEETEKFVKESTELLSTACFNLRDWDSYVEKTTLHIFCDASQFAYATCIFLRIEKEDRVDIQLIQARTRVALLKKLTIPRLELLACLIGARLAANVIQDLEFEEIPRFYWTDSTNALCWIQREDNWAAFVMNRVKEIHNLSSPESWRHIPGRLNPADLPSRGCSAESLKETRWWEGPAWLKVSQEEWPKSTIIPDLEIVYSERRKTILNTLCTTRENENLFGRYSHFLRIVRITAWIYRFFNNAKIDRRKIISEDLSTEEITKSEIILIRLIQRESFSGHEDKKLQGFKLLVDSSGILRIKTKICRREDFANFRMPILLPSDHFLVSLLIRWNHETHGHAGLQTLLGILRENYWILRSRKTVNKIINQCIRCKRFTATPATVESTSLPEDRVRDAAVLEIVGVDLTGHLILKNKKKAWIVIFTCAVYRGVHLELVTSLSMEAFLQAFRRFIARRGRPLIVYSDNGTNFKGIANALKKIDFSRLKCDPTLKNITWKFIPPGAPWWGGWWERLIGMMKQLLFRILGQTSLGYEELSTVMCDVESLMNTRPLTYLTEESEDLAPLTPSLFLHEVREVGVPDLDLIDNQTLSRKYQYIKRVREDLRERFRIEYFGFLRQETRRLKTTIPLKVGDMVLIGQESLKRLHWPLARIIQLYPGKDGLLRVAKVKTSSGDKIRPIQKLYNLEITPEIRCRDPLTERSPTQEVRLTTEEDPLTSQQEQHHIDTPNVVSSYGRPIKRPNRLDLLNFSFPCLSRRDANSKSGDLVFGCCPDDVEGVPCRACSSLWILFGDGGMSFGWLRCKGRRRRREKKPKILSNVVSMKPYHDPEVQEQIAQGHVTD